MVDVVVTVCDNDGHQKAICTQIGVSASATRAFWCVLKRIECDKISLITLPSLRQEFSDITCEFFDLAFTLATFPTFRACTSWYKLRKVFCRFADEVSPYRLRVETGRTWSARWRLSHTH
jgi:hypothetical protein